MRSFIWIITDIFGDWNMRRLKFNINLMFCLYKEKRLLFLVKNIYLYLIYSL